VTVPVIPAKAEVTVHPDGSQSVRVHVDVLDLVNRFGIEEARKITGLNIALPPNS